VIVVMNEVLIQHLSWGGWTRLVVQASPIVWVAGKEWLRQRLVARHGQVTPLARSPERGLRVWLTAIATVACVAGLIGVLTHPTVFTEQPFTAALALGYLVAFPIAVWAVLRTVPDIVVALFLVVQAVKATDDASTGYVPVLVLAVASVGLGLKQYHDHRALAAKLRSLVENSR
jgi:hypothetical protein